MSTRHARILPEGSEAPMLFPRFPLRDPLKGIEGHIRARYDLLNFGSGR